MSPPQIWGAHGLVDLVVSYLVLLVMQLRSGHSVACAASSVPVRLSIRRAPRQARSILHWRMREKRLHESVLSCVTAVRLQSATPIFTTVCSPFSRLMSDIHEGGSRLCVRVVY